MAAYLVFDLEATGLQPERNEIIEVGAVKIVDGVIVDRFDQLCRPLGEFPAFISHMTGITPEMLKDEPTWAEVWPRFSQFAEGCVWVAHNVVYDISMLKAVLHNLRLSLPDVASVDTQDLITLFHPSLSSLRLESVAQSLGVAMPTAHRAVSDAEATAQIFLKLLKRFEEIPLGLLTYYQRLIAKTQWPLKQHVNEVLARRTKALPLKQAMQAGEDWAKYVDAGQATRAETDRSKEKISKLGEVSEWFAPDGRLQQTLGQFEYRPSQQQMAEQVDLAFEQDAHALIEAGTGTGKSFAYLVPAALHSLRTGEQVVISTYTKTLQHQLLDKDVPILQKLLGDDVQVALIKGRENYICLRKWEEAFQEAHLGRGSAIAMGAWLTWLTQTQTGDLSELHGSVATGLSNRVKSETSTCIAEKCRHFKRCFAFKARREARHADVVLTNHALLLRDLAGDHFILKSYDRLVIDEAHHLEAAATDAFRLTVSSRALWHELRLLFNEKNGQGFLPALKTVIKQRHTPELLTVIEPLHRQWQIVGMDAERWLLNLQALILDPALRSGQSRYEHNVQSPMTEAIRALPQWREQCELAMALVASLNIFFNGLLQAQRQLLDAAAEDSDLQAALGNLRGPWENLQRMAGGIERFMAGSSSEVCWIEANDGPRTAQLSLVLAPQSVDQILLQQLFMQKRSVILTSATLSINGSFEYVKQRIGLADFPAERIFDCVLPSEFDYQRQALLCLPTDVPKLDGAGKSSARDLADWLLPVLKASRGRALVLFTSYAQLEQVAQYMREPAKALGLSILTQTQMQSAKRAVFERFKSGGGAPVLLATSSFWEGIDVPGEALSLLVVVKLPFDVPSDPMVQARVKLLETQGSSGFMDYQVPRAVLRFKQGVGRLIRSRDDRGVVLVLDDRVTTKRYGEAFLQALETYSQMTGTQAEIVAEVEHWLVPSAAVSTESHS